MGELVPNVLDHKRIIHIRGVGEAVGGTHVQVSTPLLARLASTLGCGVAPVLRPCKALFRVQHKCNGRGLNGRDEIKFSTLLLDGRKTSHLV